MNEYDLIFLIVILIKIICINLVTILQIWFTVNLMFVKFEI